MCWVFIERIKDVLQEGKVLYQEIHVQPVCRAPFHGSVHEVYRCW
jgi:uncharacterized protein YqcC (DUF446 family)